MSKLPSLQVSLSLRATLTSNELVIDLAEMRHVLREISDTQSILAAAEASGTTYRTLWGRLELYERALGKPVVKKAPGQGTHLTAIGRSILAMLDTELQPLSQPDLAKCESILSGIHAAVGGQATLLRLAASHDFAVAHCINHQASKQVEVRYMGGAKAVRALLAGEADLAGFHTPIGSNASIDPIFQAVRDRAQFRCEPLMSREQGIMIARGNPMAIHKMIDLAKPGVRFVNRQRGSGTRILLDQLLASCGMSGDAISGYEQEEFTHQAVAAMVGAGAADAGLGLRAAAKMFKLDFVSIGWETYFLAGTPETLQKSSVRALAAALNTYMRTLDGYRDVPA